MTVELNFKTTMEFRYGEAKELAPGVRRIVAENPGPFTFKGTNTYLVGTRSLAVIDPGPDLPAHRQAILEAAAGATISHILVTHTHRDHTDGVAALAAETGAAIAGFGRRAPTSPALERSPNGTEFIDTVFEPDIAMADGDRLDGEGWSLAAIHTPGHAPDHLAFALDDTGVVFSGDHVMAWNTSVVAPPEGRMSDYMRSLEKLLARRDQLYLPGHGGRIDEPQRMVRGYLIHRRWREQAILDAIRSGHGTVHEIVALVYRGLDPKLVKAASLSVLAHVEHLIERGQVACDGPPGFDRALAAI